jgi:branched-chain amino acid transport system permease protein
MELLRSSLSDMPGVNLVLYGVFLILVMLYYPGGIQQLYETYLARPRSRWIRYFLQGEASAPDTAAIRPVADQTN